MIRRPEVHKKVWGQEEWLANSPLYCGKILYVDFGACCSIHYHEKKTETFTMLGGEVLLTLGGVPMHLRKGDIVDILPGISHCFQCLTTEGAMILEVSTEHFEDDSVRLTRSIRGR
jgi:quercetin dioxygenase-like cupin family protein